LFNRLHFAHKVEMGSAKIKLSHNAKAIVKQTCYQKLTKPITINLHRIVQYKNVDRLTD